MKQVCIQGLGFVGVAMAIALSNVKTAKGKPMYFVTGIDLPTEQGLKRIDAVNQGKLPFNTADQKMATAFFAAMKTGNLLATTDESVYTSADFVIVDVPLDVALVDGEEVTLKRLGKKNGYIALIPENQAYETRYLEPERVNIQGELASLYRTYH